MADPGGIEVRPLTGLEEAQAASDLFDRVWGERGMVGAPIIRAMAAHGGQVLGAFRGPEMVGAQVGLVGIAEDGRPVLHSHVTGVIPDLQHEGIGFLLKAGQREWSLAHGVDLVTWTFDPVVARNARFNLHKLGAVAVRFYRAYYGEMQDAFNVGERSDRLEVRWDLRSERVERAMAGEAPEPPVEGAVVVVDEVDGRPVAAQMGAFARLLVRVPSDYHALRERDRAAATAWRDAVAAALDEALAAGYTATGFLRAGAYVLERG